MKTATEEMSSGLGDLTNPADALDNEKFCTAAYCKVTQNIEEPTVHTPCHDCKKTHLPRRLICCVDGTWMSADGTTGATFSALRKAYQWNHAKIFSKGSEEGNATNVFRIWASIKEGEVTDKNGKSWQQIGRYFPGIGATLGMSLQKLISGITGNGFERLIYEICKFCAMNACPSSDELWLFGFSRGAFVVRAIAALLNHMCTLKPDLNEFDSKYRESLRLYRGLMKEPDLHKHEVYHHLVQNTRPSLQVRFIGVLDTVKAVNDQNLYDVSQTRNTYHVRHALALCERRSIFTPLMYGWDTFSTQKNQDPDRCCIEAWFMGGHGNIGGGMKKDGLALWPLQYLLSEAQKLGLVLGFQSHDNSKIANPLDYAMPTGKDSFMIDFEEGLELQIWDLEEQFKKGFPISLQAYKGYKDRDIAKLGSNSKGYYAIVHPSVLYHSNTSLWTSEFLNGFGRTCKIRDFRKNLETSWSQLNCDFNAQLNAALQSPRVLTCGTHGSGKSALVNMALGKKMTKEHSGTESQQHDIDYEFRSAENNLVFHDSMGFDGGCQTPYNKVQTFISSRKNEISFVNQLHCIWYCFPASEGRMNTSDREFFGKIDFKGVELMIVFTKCHELRDASLRDAYKKYCDDHSDIESLDDHDLLSCPDHIRKDVSRLAKDIYQLKQEKRIKDTKDFLKLEETPDYFFVSKNKKDRASVQKLITQTMLSLKKEKLWRNHFQAKRTYRERVLEEVIPELAKLKENPKFWALEHQHAEDKQEIFASPQKIVAKAFNLEASSDPNFDPLGEMIKAINGDSNQQEKDAGLTQVALGLATHLVVGSSVFQIPNPITNLVAGSSIKGLSQITYLAVGSTSKTAIQAAVEYAARGSILKVLAGALGPVFGIGAILMTAGIGMHINKEYHINKRYKKLVSILYTLIYVVILYDRMFWFNSSNITGEILARAMMEVSQLGKDMGEEVQKAVKLFETDDWVDIMTKVVDKFKYQPNLKQFCKISE